MEFSYTDEGKFTLGMIGEALEIGSILSSFFTPVELIDRLDQILQNQQEQKELLMTVEERVTKLQQTVADLKASEEKQEARIEVLIGEKQAAIDAANAANKALTDTNAAQAQHITDQDTNLATLQAALDAAKANAVSPEAVEALGTIDTAVQAVITEQDAFKAQPVVNPTV